MQLLKALGDPIGAHMGQIEERLAPVAFFLLMDRPGRGKCKRQAQRNRQRRLDVWQPPPEPVSKSGAIFPESDPTGSDDYERDSGQQRHDGGAPDIPIPVFRPDVASQDRHDFTRLPVNE
ncbi:MAG: hypothetical protein KJZ87_22615, partial [Thermoguttaceae bacterium]|nr:hypothetical protein [Thermoguttaceae bacterium]